MWILRTPDQFAEDARANPDSPKPRTFRIPPGRPKTFGRSGVADFTVDVPMVSRVHCRLIAADPGRLEIEDLDSTNGTFVNGERVQRAQLAGGDLVRNGRLELVVDDAAVSGP
jgi:pSer/pThr/pTyr-binding forkhead associated (FHA) protein